jgi:energy-coupling factor transporter ATP-binding protein EcfA2
MDGYVIIAFVALLAAVLLWSGIADGRRRAAKLKAELKESYGKPSQKVMVPERYAEVSQYYLRHKKDFQVDDITWNDLDMDDIYHAMDITRSSAGEEYLYYVLRTPALDPSGIHFSQEQLSFPDRDENTRIRIQTILAGLGHTGRFSIYEYLDFFDEVKASPAWTHLLAAALPLAALGVMFFHVQAGLMLLLGVLCLNIVTYYREKSRIEPYLITVKYLLRIMKTGDEIGKISCPGFEEEIAELCGILKDFSGFRRGSGLVSMSDYIGSGNPLDLLMDYIKMALHLDLIKLGSMLREVRGKADEIDRLITILGRLDACIAIASFRKSLPHSCTQDLSTDGPLEFAAEDLYHTLLKDPVTNSIRAGRPVLLTGSNASGKSTFLKAAALCALLGQTISAVPASSCRTRYFRIYSSMALRDNLQGGESYFIVEIRSLKRILDAAGKKGDTPILCFIDEVLRGTNTVERIAASTEILRSLSGKEIFCFAATHDIELTELLKESFDNYHFREEIVNKEVVFSYQLLDGPSDTRNAIRLLESIGYDGEIVDRANHRAQTFLETGTWR